MGAKDGDVWWSFDVCGCIPEASQQGEVSSVDEAQTHSDRE